MIRRMIILLTLLFISTAAYAQDKPNIVLVFLDNFGWGGTGLQRRRYHPGGADAPDGQTG